MATSGGRERGGWKLQIDCSMLRSASLKTSAKFSDETSDSQSTLMCNTLTAMQIRARRTRYNTPALMTFSQRNRGRLSCARQLALEHENDVDQHHGSAKQIHSRLNDVHELVVQPAATTTRRGPTQHSKMKAVCRAEPSASAVRVRWLAFLASFALHGWRVKILVYPPLQAQPIIAALR